MSSQKYEFDMEMTCEGCSNAAKRVLGKLGDGVKSVDANLETQKVIVESTLSREEIEEALKKTQKPVKFCQVLS